MAKTFTQDDLDRIVKAAVDYASQAAAQEARAVALQEVATACGKWSDECGNWESGEAWAFGEAGSRILALLDTPAAEAPERVRAEQFEAGWRKGMEDMAATIETARVRSTFGLNATLQDAAEQTASAYRHIARAAAIRARG